MLHSPQAVVDKRKVVTITRTITTSQQKATAAANSQQQQTTKTPPPNDSCKTAITPKCLQSIYNVPATPAKNKTNNLFVATFIGESADPADLTVRCLALYK